MRNSQAKEEVRVFLSFAEVAATHLNLATVQSQDPDQHEPDIGCIDSIEGRRAFELVELLDNNYARRREGHPKTELALYDHFEKQLPTKSKAIFEERFSNASLNFQYVNGLTENQRKKIIPRVFEKLVLLPKDFTGCALEHDFPGILNAVNISHGKSSLTFSVSPGGWLGDPTVSRIESKFLKRYHSVCPIELLAYIDGNSMFPEVVWRGNLNKYLASKSKPFPFKRIWVFDLPSKTVKFSCDEMASPLA